ncbi:hypothetical protein E3G42_001519 [Mycobacteroides abscessus]|nr:hypothetical protein A3O02_07945 [Mycobacteroides abscessus]SHP09097.1 Uncharacterised protein [Mycobacteroides abscessus subsp. abscessus]MBE5437225.1 hypothetical protein [Mycobacteroides abscessus]MBE5452035.1 hypothetical protein [Mycobacteroides abscessus]MBE5483212.1 hypothetical protein [Mycobacteroides abscessus]
MTISVANEPLAGSLGGLAARSACAEGQRADGASEASALGSTQSYCFTTSANSENGRLATADAGERRRIRWGARAMLWQASSLKAVRCCGRVLHNDGVVDPDDGQGVMIQRREVDGRMIASLHGLMTCGSVWACPRCSAVIANTRAQEIGNAVRECYVRGGRVYLLTLTLRHDRRDGLVDLWESLGDGWRSVVGGRAWTGQRERLVERKGGVSTLPAIMGDAERFDIAGVTRVVEATYGKPELDGHGWHLHIHALLFSATSLSTGLVRDTASVLGVEVDRDWLARSVFAGRIHQRWTKGVTKAGCRVPGAVAVDLREIADQGAEYVGRYLSKATYDVATRIGLETAAGSTTKEVRAERNRTPFELLAELSASVDARGFGIRTPRHWAVLPAENGDWAVVDKDTGEVMAITPPGLWRVWHEWEQASRGQHQITWSRRCRRPASSREVLWNALLDVRGTSADAADEEVAVEAVYGDVVGEISRADWYHFLAWRPSLVVDLLEAAERPHLDGLALFCGSIGVRLAASPP